MPPPVIAMTLPFTVPFIMQTVKRWEGGAENKKRDEAASQAARVSETAPPPIPSPSPLSQSTAPLPGPGEPYPPPTPEQQAKADQVNQALETSRKDQRRIRGRASTILTSNSGLTEEPKSVRRTLLGGV